MNSLVFFYFISITMSTFVLWGRDKWKAIKNGRRVSENMLLLFSLVGGFLGGILAMKYFHHKTIKGSFQTKFFIICGFRIILFFTFLYFQ